jgi:hypothetical protein
MQNIPPMTPVAFVWGIKVRRKVPIAQKSKCHFLWISCDIGIPPSSPLPSLKKTMKCVEVVVGWVLLMIFGGLWVGCPPPKGMNASSFHEYPLFPHPSFQCHAFIINANANAKSQSAHPANIVCIPHFPSISQNLLWKGMANGHGNFGERRCVVCSYPPSTNQIHSFSPFGMMPGEEATPSLLHFIDPYQKCVQIPLEEPMGNIFPLILK